MNDTQWHVLQCIILEHSYYQKIIRWFIIKEEGRIVTKEQLVLSSEF